MAITPSTLPSEEDFAALEAKLFGRVERSHTRQVRRHRLVAAAAVVVVAGAGIAAATFPDHGTAQHVAFCYSAASTTSRYVTVQSPDADVAAGADSPTAASVPAATANCLAAWQVGAVGTSPAISDQNLQACVRNDQLIAIFPKNSADSAADFCGSLGLVAP